MNRFLLSAIAGAIAILPGALLLLSREIKPANQQNPPAPPVFVDIAQRSGIHFALNASPTSQKYLIETMGGGVAIFDCNGDGLEDLFFVNGARLRNPMPAGAHPDKSDPRYWNRLYRNNGDGTFTDVTRAAGVRGQFYGMGVAVGDYDNDGRPDLYVTGFDGNALYHNNGDGTFSDVTEQAHVQGGGWSSSALFVDYDRDGRLDLIVARYLDWDFSRNPPCGNPASGNRAYCHPDIFRPMTYLVYHNEGHGAFTDVSAKSGIGADPGKGLGTAFNDYDHDGWPDILVANDTVAQQLFHNNHDGTFTDAGMQSGIAYDEDGQAFSGMGVAFDDYDNDGWPDIFIDDLANQKFALFQNQKGLFRYVSGQSGIASITMAHSGWGTGFFDYDNDGWKDLFVGESHVLDNVDKFQPGVRYLEPLALLRNIRGHFEDVSRKSGRVFQQPLAARGVAFGDLDNDGSVDIVVSRLNGNALILKNQSSRRHWLTVNTVGTLSNRDGIGARLRLVTGSGVEQFGLVTTGGSYLSASDKRVHFGLGSETLVRNLEIIWPSGIIQNLSGIKADQVITVREAPNSTRETPNKGLTLTWNGSKF